MGTGRTSPCPSSFLVGQPAEHHHVSIESIVAFWGISILFVLTPGADWAYAIAAGLGRHSIAPSVTGLLLGHLVATLVVAAGVGAVVMNQPLALTGLTVIGAIYLIWMGVATIRHPATLHADARHDSESPGRQLMKGFGVSGLNPKVFLLFLSLLPQFTNTTAPWPISLQIVVLGLVHTASCAVVYTTVALGARQVLQARPSAARRVSILSGGAMVLVGLVLLAEWAFG